MSHDTTTPDGLKSARKALGMKRQADLAAAIGVHKVTLAKMEAGMIGIEKRTALAVRCLLLDSGAEAPITTPGARR